eukprot:CAMPEP_0117679336 /NCGR_PEP_ID=MMETSP0804-20121206/17762_1 /TAXON_ID=1074897 /ORGANISM="Tetraselmis astigmatica, Strain CCMP880" /LENGTH=114 /DNA_ID=CAMNT_0005488755 /DNA_START=442 /DNA_END=788 /DNA_ORIENTATION=+
MMEPVMKPSKRAPPSSGCSASAGPPSMAPQPPNGAEGLVLASEHSLRYLYLRSDELAQKGTVVTPQLRSEVVPEVEVDVPQAPRVFGRTSATAAVLPGSAFVRMTDGGAPAASS